MSEGELIDGKATARAVRAEVALEVAWLREHGVQPSLAVVLVGEDPASQVYVKNKDKAATDAGFRVETVRLDASTRQGELLERVGALVADRHTHGILVQLPLPDGLESDPVVRSLDPAKDVDGLHPENVAALAMGREGMVPCTPAGCIVLCDRHGIELEGARAVVLGRSQLVGRPLAQLLVNRNATVTICHSRTRDLAGVCREADVLFVAVGRPRLVKADWVRPGAAVIDVGIHRGEDGKLFGDVDFEAVRPHARAITPVPGGVGPMTIAMLLSNTALAAARQNGLGPALEERRAETVGSGG